MYIALLREFFGWMTLINLGLLTWTALMCLCCKNLIHRVHGTLFGLEPETINSFLYGFLALYKLVFIVFLLVPWIALVIMS